MTLGEYFQTVKNFAGYGVMDCCIFPSNWVFDQTGIDPLARFRGRYNDIETASVFINEYGSLPRLLDKNFHNSGMKTAQQPIDGDVGCIVAHDEVVGSIMKDNMWWVLGPAGKSPVKNVRLIKAWTF